MKTQTSITTRRFRKAKATSLSIIEKYSALDDHAIADLETALDHSLIASLESGLHRNRFEDPGRHLCKHLISVVLQHQGRRRNGRQQLPRPEEHHVGEHSGLKSQGRVFDADADLGATRVHVEHIADKEDLAFEDLSWIGREDDID